MPKRPGFPIMTLLALTCAVGIATTAAADQPSAFRVAFVHPEQFTDAVYARPNGTEQERNEVLLDMTRHLERLAGRGLPPGEALQVEVLDIDLAGGFNPFWPRSNYLRIVSEIYWPRIKLHYTLKQGDQVIASGEEQLSDQTYLMTVNPYDERDRFRYEKPMLDAWFARAVAAGDTL